MPWRIVVTPRAERELKRLPPREQARMKAALDDLTVFPRRGDLQKLHGSREEWRLRVGDYRVRFLPDSGSQVIAILRVLPRDQAYRQ